MRNAEEAERIRVRHVDDDRGMGDLVAMHLERQREDGPLMVRVGDTGDGSSSRTTESASNRIDAEPSSTADTLPVGTARASASPSPRIEKAQALPALASR